MKRNDLFFALVFTAIFLPFFISDVLLAGYKNFNIEHPLITAFVKFAILATMGEMLGLRIRSGNYNKEGFGLLPRALVWGFLGITIYFAFAIFAAGIPALLSNLGMEAGDEFGTRLLTAFTISTLLNLFYAPVMMTMHKITDMHILTNNGSLRKFFTSFPMGRYFIELDWHTQYHFIFKKTIPLFWIPAQTINFMLPAEYRVLVAALLGVALGVLLSVAGPRKQA